MLKVTGFVPAMMLSTTALAGGSPAQAAPHSAQIALGQMDLDRALLLVARLTDREIIFSSDLVAGRKAPHLSGRFTAEEAVRRLLAGSGLDYKIDDGAIIIVRVSFGETAEPPTITVTGTRIRGAQAYAPLGILGRENLRRQGVTDLGDAVRRVPQNFGGGQSPNIGLGAEDYGSDNLNSGSAINLRGLGPDATLTLLNGHRLAYDGAIEGVDVSSIPLAAVDRIEIVADGASAIYGSDAVAGVANVVLRRDATGLYTSARLGATTDGGDRQQQYELVTGSRWAGGGGMVALSYDRNSAITAGQRSFTDALGPDTVIYPRMRHIAGVASAHQAIGSAIDASIDTLYSRRRSFTAFPYPGETDYREGGVVRSPSTESFAVAPSFIVNLSPQWSATLSTTYGRDITRYHTRFLADGAVIIDSRGRYDNKSVAAEGSAEGPLATLSGGDLRLALGTGYRRASLFADSVGTGLHPSPRQGHRESIYGFAELNAPLVGSANRRPGLERLSFNAAGRFEHYPELGNVFTPKFGALYAPSPVIELRATWGRSFKAPTLYQLFEAPNAVVYDATLFGANGYPPTATAIYSYGGNPNLKPQKATTWSAGFVLTPLGDHRVKVEGSYFDTRYRDRIAAPFPSVSTALSDPVYASLVDLDPTLEEIDAITASADLGLLNGTDRPFDPADVIAIIDDHNRNVASQKVSGVDLAASGHLALGAALDLELDASGTYLDSKQRLLAGLPETQLAGEIFRPPHFRGQAGATISGKALSFSSYVNITAGSRDARYSPVTRVDGQTTIDVSTRYAAPARSGVLSGVSVLIAVVNLFNTKPDRIRSPDPLSTPFDATNFGPVGRSISLTLAKQW